MKTPFWCALLLTPALALPLSAGGGRSEISPDAKQSRAPSIEKAAAPARIFLQIPDVKKAPVPASLSAAPVLTAGVETAFAPAPLADSLIAGPEAGRPSPAPPADPPAALEDTAFSGRILFDRLASWIKGPDIIPAWPGRPGDTLRLNGRKFSLDEKLEETAESVVYRSKDGGDYAVTLVNPALRNDPGRKRELAALEELSRTDVPHPPLIARSPDGLILIQERVQGETADQVRDRGALRDMKDGLAETAARLIRLGRTADLGPSNLAWNGSSQQWTLLSAKGFAPARPWQVLRQFLQGDLPKSADFTPAEFLAALRGRFGPDSPAWRAIKEDAARAPPLQKYLAALAREDRNLPPAPSVQFVAMPEDSILSDAPVGWSEIKKRLGFDPRGVSAKNKLHQDDPGKTNTEVYSIRPEGKPQMILKLSDRGAIRNELAMRRIVRRYFAKYFDTPRSLGNLGMMESGMVMEYSPGQPSYARDALNLEQRVALALLARTFGLTDVNRGNVLSEPRERVVLIDFEYAFARMTPNSTALPMDSIVDEMPWVSRFEKNRSEQYLPAIRAWRKLLLKPATQAEIAGILRSSGFSDKEIPPLMDTLRRNVADLEWGIQNDVEYANFFTQGARRRTNP